MLVNKPKKLTYYIFSISLLLCILISSANGEDAQNDDADMEADAEAESEMENEASEYSDWICTVVMSLICAFFVSLLGALFGYISVLDDIIMAKYRREGTTIEGEVIELEYIRGSSEKQNCFRFGKKEYNVVVEYETTIRSFYCTRLRKQFQVYESDFIEPAATTMTMTKSKVTELSTIGEITDIPTDLESPTQSDVQSPKSGSDGPPQIEIDNSDTFFKEKESERKRINLVILKDYPQSGLPAQQLDRRLSIRYRFSSLVFVLSTILVSVMSFRITADTIWKNMDEEEQQTGWNVFFAFACLTLMQLPCIHCCLGQILVSYIEEEYFDSADFKQSKFFDDSTLSSKESSVYSFYAKFTS